ncbi:hypothetical protein PAXINDRAFT_9616 [Paxillus involutus ATCC 200175]|nr:hypothetical protein PAXINDRAFT_9616 [Paxillus involutus ATCC 200175]
MHQTRGPWSTPLKGEWDARESTGDAGAEGNDRGGGRMIEGGSAIGAEREPKQINQGGRRRRLTRNIPSTSSTSPRPSRTTARQRCREDDRTDRTNGLHDPGGETDTPSSIQLEGDKANTSSRGDKPGDCTDERSQSKAKQAPSHDGRRGEPTEPPDDEDGA